MVSNWRALNGGKIRARGSRGAEAGFGFAVASWVTGVNAGPRERGITVTWDPAAGADGYRVQWKSGDQSFGASRQGAVAGGAVSRYEIANLEVAREYAVRVIAVKADHLDGPPSVAATARAAGMGPVAAVVEPLPEVLAQAVPVALGGEGRGHGVLTGPASENGPADPQRQAGQLWLR